MEARFLAKVDKTGENGCWIWTAYKNPDGYGEFHIDGKTCKTHRIAYELWKGEIPDGLLVRHQCNTPACVNPEHLEVGTPRDNVDDMVRAGRQNCGRGEAHGSAKLTEAQISDIRSRVGQTQQEIADEFGVSQQQISKIWRGERWNHI